MSVNKHESVKKCRRQPVTTFCGQRSVRPFHFQVLMPITRLASFLPWRRKRMGVWGGGVQLDRKSVV